MEKTEALTLCKKHINRYVLIQMSDGNMFDGIIESVDEQNIYLAVPVGDMVMQHGAPLMHGHGPGHGHGHGHGPHCGCGGVATAGAGHHHIQPYQHSSHGRSPSPNLGYGYGPGYGPGFGYGPGYGYGYGPGYYGPRRRFNRVILPLAAFTALSLLPYF